jgi:replicative DNA helicase
MNNILLYIFRLFFDSRLYFKYRDSFNLEFVKLNHRELYRLFITIEKFHEKFPEKSISSVEEFETFYRSLYPASHPKDHDELQLLLKRVADLPPPNESVAAEYLAKHRQQSEATSLAILAMEVSEGRKTLADLRDKLQTVVTIMEGNGPDDDNEFVSDDLVAMQAALHAPGLHWPVNILNQMLGPLRRGDFGFIFARPESGKTTFLAHSVSYMATQTEGTILWFNNEEQGEKVLSRCIQALFGITSEALFSNYEKYRTIYREKTGGRIKIFDRAGIYYRDVERLCRKHRPSLIIFDQIDKIKGFKDDRHTQELKALYQWARELAKEYGPVIAVCQAGASGEGKKYLTMDDVDESKTAKQGEADWILGIGKSHQEGMESVRHFHLSKNKLFGDVGSRPELRHGKQDVLFYPEIARYKDLPTRR